MMEIKQHLSRTLYLFSVAGALCAQSPQAPPPSEVSAPSVVPGEQPPPYQLTVKVQRVILDVVVTDPRGNPVEGLKQDDFKVLEDGVPQPIRSFDVHSPAVAGASHPPLDLHLPPNVFTNITLAPADKPVTILLYDMLNTPQSALPYAHEELVKFIKSQKSSTKIAIFVLSDRLHMVQGFTDNETLLMAALDSKNARARISQLRLADTAADESSLLASDPASAPTPANPNVPPSTTDTVLSQLNDALTSEQEFMDTQRIQVTVDAFSQIARFVASLPGRKNLIWMSGAFPVELWPGRKPPSAAVGAFNIASRFDDEIRTAQGLLKDSRLAIYPVDVRGLRTDPQFALTATAPRLPTRVPIGGGGPPPPRTFGVQNAAEHATMNAIAESSGGRAFYDTNGLKDAMDTALLQGSEYYSITYAPTNAKDDGGERKVKVVMNNPRYQLSYRESYLTPDDAHPTPMRTLALDMNMQHGAPNSSELFFEAKVVPVGSVMTASPAEMDGLKSFLQIIGKAKRTKFVDDLEKVQHYDINLVMVGRQLEMPKTSNGKYATAMRLGLAAYTENSELLNGTEVSIKNSIPATQYQKIQSDGYHASMVFAVPEEAVSLRIAVRDEIGNRLGTIEVPLPIPPPKNTTAATATTK
jgi:VWFA-related protein